jgi:hypothetical protein
MNNIWLDESEITRLADGELDIESQNDILAKCEAAPDGYRIIALAFIENMRIANLLNDLDSTSDPSDASHIGCSLPQTQTQTLPQTVAPIKKPNVDTAARSRAWQRGAWLCSIAASLTIGILIGVRSPDPSDPRGGAAVNSSAPIVDSTNASLPAMNPVPQNEMLANRPRARATAPYNQQTLTSLARELKPQPTLDDEAINLLRDNGLRVDRASHLFVFEMPDGNQLAVPAEFTFVRSITE